MLFAWNIYRRSFCVVDSLIKKTAKAAKVFYDGGLLEHTQKDVHFVPNKIKFYAIICFLSVYLSHWSNTVLPTQISFHYPSYWASMCPSWWRDGGISTSAFPGQIPLLYLWAQIFMDRWVEALITLNIRSTLLLSRDVAIKTQSIAFWGIGII